MRDEIYDRDLQLARHQLARDFLLLGQAIGSAFRVLTRVQFEAPWRGEAADCTQPR
ncbi:MAG: hypothetical protein ABR588_07565 [Sphingomicrobium sp.]|nr:hypothetical protein [Sphingomonadales bacterium]